MKKCDVKLLDRQLREAAQRERAKISFSPLLHERVMTVLRSKGLEAQELRPEGRSWLWRIAVPLGMAAAVAVIAWLLLQPGTDTTPKPEIVGPQHPAPVVIPQAPGTASPEDINLATANALERGRYAYLDRDAEKLLTFVANQLPSLPPAK